ASRVAVGDPEQRRAVELARQGQDDERGGFLRLSQRGDGPFLAVEEAGGLLGGLAADQRIQVGGALRDRLEPLEQFRVAVLEEKKGQRQSEPHDFMLDEAGTARRAKIRRRRT